MKFTWIGGPSFRLELGPFAIVGDPVFADRFALDGVEVTRVQPAPAVNVADADVVLVTSARADHCDEAAIARCGTSEIFGVEGVPGATLLDAGEPRTITKGEAGLVISPVAASEGASGFFLRLLREARVFTAYITGDTLFGEHTRQLQQSQGYSNLLVINLGAERSGRALRSADSKDAMQIVYRMQPNAIAAVHHSTFSHYTEPVDPFLEKIGLTIYDNRLRRLREGESFEKTI